MPSVVAYHVGVLATWEAIKEVGLADQRGGLLHESVVGEDPAVLALLKDKEAEDEGRLSN